MVVGTLVVTDRAVFKRDNRWFRVTKVIKYALRATKGYIKDGPAQLLVEQEVQKPRRWKSERIREFYRRR